MTASVLFEQPCTVSCNKFNILILLQVVHNNLKQQCDHDVLTAGKQTCVNLVISGHIDTAIFFLE